MEEVTMDNEADQIDPEFVAMQKVYLALKDLDSAAQNRVLDYVLNRLSITREDWSLERPGSSFSPRALAEETLEAPEKVVEERSDHEEELGGISSVAQKWIRRNGLKDGQLTKLFTLGLDQIDLVAKKVPGQSKRQKMRNIILLTAAASYLGTGTPRVAYDNLKDALTHYNAYDGTNFAAYMKDFGSEVSGSKESGFTLTARGLAEAAELIITMTSTK
jgi:hypothetical protein